MLKILSIKYGSISVLFLILGILSFSVHSRAKESDKNNLSNLPSKPRSEKEILELVSISDGKQTITLPLRVFIINDLQLEKREVKMKTWITPKEIADTILPEINRIWKPAGIQWELESIIVQPSAKLTNKAEHIQYIQNSVRTAKKQRFPERTIKIQELCGKQNQHPKIHNLYFFPYLGQTYQGFARMRGNTAYLGVWTDKYSKGKQPPKKALLTEPEPMQRGSLGRTAAHELGHNLGLIHPDKPTQKIFNRVMGGRKQGYQLTGEEIKIARSFALKRAKNITN